MRYLIVRIGVALVTFSIGVGIVWLMPAASSASKPILVTQESVSIPVSLPETSVTLDHVKPANQFVLDYDPKKFNPRGDYYILGKTPKVFREFELLEIAVEERDGKPLGEVVLATNYYGDNEDYYMTAGNSEYVITGKITKNRLTFVATTVSEEDFEFRFDGYFLVSGRVASAGRNKPVLKGKLVKFKNGVKIAEGEVKFRVEYLGC
jgi:hypothetical protein